MSKIKKIVAVIIVMCMMCSYSVGPITSNAANNSAAATAVENICNTSGFRPNVDNYSDCYAYVSAFCQKLYGTAPGGTSGYTLTRPGSFYMVGQTCGTGVTASTLSSLLSQAMPGDVVQMYWDFGTGRGQHTAIIYSADSTSFTILQDGASFNTIKKSTYVYSSSYTRWRGSGYGISLYRYNGYNNMFGSDPGSSKPPTPTINYVSISEGNYKIQNSTGVFLNVDAGGNSGANVFVSSENNSAEQKFRIQSKGNKQYYIRSIANSNEFCLNAWTSQNVLTKQSDVKLYQANDVNSKFWGFQDAGGGYYYIRCMMNPNFALTADSGNSGANVTVLAFDGRDTQKWKLVNANATPTPTTYTITYNANGGSGAPQAQTKQKGTNITIPSTIPSRFGYSFVGWAPSSTAEKANYIPGSVFSKNADTTLYAVWGSPKELSEMLGQRKASYEFVYANKCRYYKITPKYDGAYQFESLSDLDAKISIYNSSGELLAQDDNSGTGNNFFLIYKLNAGTTYYIKMESKEVGTVNYCFTRQFVIKYDANGGTGAPETQYKLFKSDINLSAKVPTRNGYVFMGWALNKSDTSATYYAGDNYALDSDKILYAVWEQKDCAHDWQWITVSEATCTEDGEKYLKCSLCDATQNSMIITSTGHSFGEWIVVTDPTNNDFGTEERTCSKCNETESRSIDFTDILGDVCYDGKLTIEDAQAILEFTEYSSTGDVNTDGIITAADAREVLRSCADSSVLFDHTYIDDTSAYLHYNTYIVNDSELVISVYADRMKDVESGDISLVYDPSVLEFVGCISTCAADITAVKILGDGEVGFSFAYLNYAEDDTPICQYRFKILEETAVQIESNVYSWSGIGEPFGFIGSILLGDDNNSDHDHDFTEVITHPTCNDGGYTMYLCECGFFYVDNYVEATNMHEDFDNDGICDFCFLGIPIDENDDVIAMPDLKPDDTSLDYDNDGYVTTDDAVYVLKHIMMPDIFVLTGSVDFDNNGYETTDDAVYLLKHIMMPDIFPI